MMFPNSLSYSVMAALGNVWTKWTQEHNYFGFARCVDGQISHLELATPARIGIQGRSANRCGFGSYLAYLCFQNIEHYPPGHRRFSGFDMERDVQNLGDNINEVMNGLVMQYCRRIIYVRYSGVGIQGVDIKLRRGNKAFIYAAMAADFYYLIVYNDNPCQDQCCTWGNTTGLYYPRTKIFYLPDMIGEFNLWQPPWLNPDASRNRPRENLDDPRDFAQHNGNRWYFCRPY